MKKSFRLLSTILAAVIILTTVAFGAYAGLDDLLNPERNFLEGINEIVFLSKHEKDVNALVYPVYDGTETGVLGGFSKTVVLSVDLQINADAGAPDILWSPTGGYSWVVKDSSDTVVATSTGKNVSIETVAGESYTAVIVIIDKDNDGVVNNFDDEIYFEVPAAVATADKAALQRLFDKAFASSSQGYKDAVWKPFERARTNAYMVLNNTAATEDDVQAAFDFLEATYGELGIATSKLSGIGNYFLMIWESIRFALWDLFLAKIFTFAK